MLTLGDIALFALAAFAASHWWRARGFKSQALHLAWQRCRLLQVQLLDQSVVLKKIRLQRGESGSMQLRRTYDFEFSSTGTDRYKGTLILAGARLLSIEMEPHVVPDDNDAFVN
jgi:trehalose/maltose hydrolase-like predicted phosphorylase